MTELSPEEVEKLAEKWLEGTLTGEEEQLFNHWYEKAPRAVIDFHSRDKNADDFRSRVLVDIKSSLSKQAPAGKPETASGTGTKPRRSVIWTAAAAAAVMLCVGLYIYHWMQPVSTSLQTAQALIDAPAGMSKATLTLASGEVIYLDRTSNGQLATQGSTRIVKLDNGLLRYQSDQRGTDKNAGVVWNTLNTPVGGDYKLVLSDGTKVWLNAASSIRYPATFTGDTRTVQITGEAYFEVVHNDRIPFQVITGKTVINDLGTHFNINAYRDEPGVKVTLLEGSVEVVQSASNAKQLLHPGQQVNIDKSGHMQLDKQADTQGAIAWKNGLLNFNGKDLASVMRQLERWYNVSVSYPEKMPALIFSGDTYRNSSLTEVLKVLELNGVKCRLTAGTNGRAATIVIAPR